MIIAAETVYQALFEYICQINVVDEVGRKFASPRAKLVVE